MNQLTNSLTYKLMKVKSCEFHTTCKEKKYCMRSIFLLIAAFWAGISFAADPTPRTLTSYLTEFGQLSPYRLFFQPAQTDSLQVEFSFPKDASTDALIRICRPHGFRISIFENKIFILRNTSITTELPGLHSENSVVPTSQPSGAVVVARSEYKIYEIGTALQADSTYVYLSGTVRDFKTGASVPGATIQLANNTTGTTTNRKGEYILSLKPGLYEINVGGLGLHATRRQVRIHSSGTLDIETEEQIFEISELTILSSRTNKVKDTGMGVERFRMKEIKNIPSVFGETDVLKAVLTLPGVKSGGELSGGFNVRGGATDQNLVILNHNTIYNPTHLFGLLSAFNPDLSDNMELYMSNIPAKYGGRIASVLDVSSRRGNNQKMKGSASLGMLTSRIALEGPAGASTQYAVGARASYSDWMMRMIPEKSGYTDGKAGFYDLNAVVHHRFNESKSLQLHAYYSKDQFNFEPTERFSYENMNFSASYRKQHNYRMYGSYTAGYDHYNNAIRNDANQSSAYQLSTRIQQVFARADYDFYLNTQHTLNMGIHLLYYNLQPGSIVAGSSRSLVTPETLQTDRAMENAVYISDEWNISDKMALNAGIRYSFYQLLGPRRYQTYLPGFIPDESTMSGLTESDGLFQKQYNGPEFRLSARYILRDDLSVKAGINSMRQYIHKISNATVMSPTDTWKLSDHHIRPQSGVQWAAGIYKNFFLNQLISSAEIYYKTTDHYLDYRSGAQLVMNPHIETEVTETRGKAYGVELSVKKPAGKLNGWLSYTWSRSFLQQYDPLLSNPVNNGDWFVSDIDKPHDFKFIGNYKFTQRYSLSYNLFYSTGRPITLPVSKYKFAGGEYVYYSDRNMFRIPDFMRMDASFNIEPSHHLTRLTHSMLTFGIYNLTGRKNVYSIFFKPELGKLKGYQLSIFGAPIPYISYTIKF